MTKTLIFLLDVLASFSVALIVLFIGMFFGLSTSTGAFVMVYLTTLIAWRTL